MIDFGISKIWTCDECPIVCEFERRMSLAERENYFEYFGLFDHCGCDKIDGKLWMWHGCEDAWADRQDEHHDNNRKSGRAYRREMSKKHFNRMRNVVMHHGTMSVGLGPRRTEDPENYAYVRRMHNSRHKAFLKRYANRMTRRSTDFGNGKSAHKKVFNVEWEMW